MKLSELKVGTQAKIVSINLNEKVKQRLYDLGVREGVIVKVLRFAPFKSPIEIEIQGYALSIGELPAENILVRCENGK